MFVQQDMTGIIVHNLRNWDRFLKLLFGNNCDTVGLRNYRNNVIARGIKPI